MFIVFSVKNFSNSAEDSHDAISINGDIAKIEVVRCKSNFFYHFINVCNGLSDKYQGSITLNKIELKHSKLVQNYIQKHCLFITTKPTFEACMSIRENLAIQSYLWSGQDLSQEAIVSLGISKFLHKRINELSTQELNLLNLAKIVLCNSHMWFLPCATYQNIPHESKELVKNVFEIRTKQGGLAVLFDWE